MVINFPLPAIWLVVSFALLSGCTWNEPEVPLQACTTIYPPTEREPDSTAAWWSPRSLKGVANETLLWPATDAGAVQLVVRFLDGNDWQKEQVKEHVLEWTRAADGMLQFIFLSETDRRTPAHIRILFDTIESKSFVGSGASGQPQNAPTMWLGDVRRSQSRDDVKGVILHEFGHALGLNHEHQHPDVQIPWDTVAVYTYYRDRHRWSKGMVDTNIFILFNGSNDQTSDYDQTSIMHYWVLDTLTKGDFEIPVNNALSQGDIAFIRELYKI